MTEQDAAMEAADIAERTIREHSMAHEDCRAPVAHAIIDRLRASAPPSLDVERLARAIHKDGSTCVTRYGRRSCSGPDHGIFAAAIAAAYLQDSDAATPPASET